MNVANLFRGTWALVAVALIGCDGTLEPDAAPGAPPPVEQPTPPPDDVAAVDRPAFGTGNTDVGRYYRLRNVSSNLCMDVESAGQGNGARVLQWTCSSGENQQFYLRQITAIPEYQLSAKHSAKCLRSDGGSSSDVRIEQDPCARQTATGFSGSRFVVTRVGTTTPARYTLRNGATGTAPGKCIQGQATSGSEVLQRNCSTSTSQHWILEERAFRAQGGTAGQWSAVTTIPLVPAAAALLPNRKILVWSSWANNRFGGGAISLDQTRFAVFDPLNPGTVTSRISDTAHNMFCPGIALLADGRVFVNGGDDSHTRTTSIYDPVGDRWVAATAMAQSRWYNSSVTLPDGRVFTIAGHRTSGATGSAEIWNPTGNSWSAPSNLPATPLTEFQPAEGRAQEHPRLFIAPNGKIFVPGPTPRMQWYDVAGAGTVTFAGERKDPRTGFLIDEFSQNDITVMYDVGKILKAGGNPSYDRTMFGQNARHVASSHRSFVIDINGGGTAAVTEIGPTKWPRNFGNGVVLPSGQVVLVGGLDNAKGFLDDGHILPAEMFDPATNSWTELAPMAKPRPYHSVALLLPDARVFVGGGGLCSSDTCSVNHPDYEIFTPPYLLNGVARPTLSGVPATVSVGSTFDVSTTGTVTGFSLVRTTGVTHSTNTDQRYLRLASSSAGAGAFTITAPANRNLAPPGYYLLFALNGQTPSIAAMVKIQ